MMLLGFAVLFAFVSTCHAQSSQNIEVQTDAGRAGHSFSLLLDGDEYGAGIPSRSLFEASGQSHLSLSVTIDTERGFSILDDTAGDFLFFNSGVVGGSTAMVSSSNWQRSDGLPVRQYFLVPQERSNHSFLLGQTNYGYTLATKGPSLQVNGNGSGGAVTRREVSASYISNAGFWLVDLNTNERSALNATNTAVSPWSANTNVLPAGTVRLFLGTGENEQVFTLHSRVPGGPEQVQSVTAYALYASPGSWDIGGYVDEDGTIYTQDHTGNELVVSPGTCVVTGVVPLGAEFWLTRDADNASGPVCTMDNMANRQWAYGGFPELLPVRSHQRYTFQLPANGSWSHVVHDDGYVASLNIESTGWLYSYDDYGNIDQAVEYVMAYADVDTLRTWYVVDPWGSRYGDDFATNLLYWNPTHAEPPTSRPNTVAVTIPLVGWTNVTLDQDGWSWPLSYDSSLETMQMWNGYIQVNVQYGGAQYWTYEAVDGNGQWLYSIPCVTTYVPYNSWKPFWISGTASNEQTVTSTPDVTDLHDWFPPPASRSLSISSSRWGHDLWLCHPNGHSFQIQQHATQGNISFDPNQQAWFNSYYYFDATTEWHNFLDWWVEDRTTGEKTPKASAVENGSYTIDNYLIDWVSVPQPQDLTASASTELNTVELAWKPNGASVDGSFSVERRVGGSGTWQQIGTVQGSERDANGTYHFTDARPVFKSMHYYRVYYHFGGQRSAPSVEISFSGYNDSDGDGIIDALEIRLGRNPYSSVDVNADSDGDGTSDLNEINSGRDPGKKDSPVVKLKVFGFATP